MQLMLMLEYCSHNWCLLLSTQLVHQGIGHTMPRNHSHKTSMLLDKEMGDIVQKLAMSRNARLPKGLLCLPSTIILKPDGKTPISRTSVWKKGKNKPQYPEHQYGKKGAPQGGGFETPPGHD